MNSYIDRMNISINDNPELFEIRRRQEWHDKLKPEIVYNYETISKTQQIAFICFAIIVFPVGLAILTHKIIGKIMFSGWLTVNQHRKTFIYSFVGSENGTEIQTRILAKRINFLVNGQVVDAFIIGRPENINNGKWALVATGIGCCMEDMQGYHDQDNSYQHNRLFFNYPGVGSSSGLPSKAQVINTYRAMLHFLEDSETGIGAKEIICWGRSMGGAIQAEALKDHVFQDQIKYTLVRDRSFARLSEVFWYAKILKLIGWEFDGVAASEKLEKLGRDEIILQPAHYDYSFNPQEDLHCDDQDPLTADRILNDGTISSSRSLAYALLSKRNRWQHKKFVSVNGRLGHFTLPSLQSCVKIGMRWTPLARV